MPRRSLVVEALMATVVALGAAADAQSPAPGPAASRAGPSLPPAPFSIAPSGSVFQFSKSKVVIGPTDGYFVTYTSNGTPRKTTLIAARDTEQYSSESVGELAKIWPLSVGKTVRYRRYEPRGGTHWWSDDVTVTGTETLKIGDKSVDTYVVRWNSHGEDRGNHWEGTATTWYAPALGWVVKVQRSDTQGVREEDRAVSYVLAR